MSLLIKHIKIIYIEEWIKFLISELLNSIKMMKFYLGRKDAVLQCNNFIKFLLIYLLSIIIYFKNMKVTIFKYMN